MYSVGENFYYEIEDEEYEYLVVGDMIIKGKEYLIAEDEEHNRRVFIYDDGDETVYLIEDEDSQDELLELWENEFYGTSEEVGIWDDDEYSDDYESELDDEDFVDIDGLSEFEEDDEEDLFF